MADDVGTAALRDRVEGAARNGFVTIRDFDEGVVETLGAVVIGEGYFIPELKKYDAPPEDPGVPVVFAAPEDVFQTHRVPVIEVRRDDISPAMNRWHPGHVNYRVPSYGALPVQYGTGPNARRFFNSTENYQQSCPYDILYTVQVVSNQRSAMASANAIIHHVMKVYQPYCRVVVKDSIGDLRSYEAFAEGIAPMDNVPGVANRVIGFALSLRVEAELDINDPYMMKTVTAAPVLRLKVKDED